MIGFWILFYCYIFPFSPPVRCETCQLTAPLPLNPPGVNHLVSASLLED